MSVIGIVVIGRNEGERLRSCLESVAGRGATVVYVDSGSTDGSVALARGLGALVVDLDMTISFTAARARNAGVDCLLGADSEVRYIQFVDGDCELAERWLDRAAAELEGHSDWGVVCGRLRERHPERSVYNRLADLEWDTPVGEARSCGGIAMMRRSAFVGVGGFDSSLMAGEEPELCGRLRKAGWRVYRLGVEMGRHDIAMTRFGQWWRRCMRGGYAYAEGVIRRDVASRDYWMRAMRGIVVWGLLLPVAAVGLAWPTGGWSLALLLAYPLQWARIGYRAGGRGWSASDCRLYAASCLLAKFPQAAGVLRYVFGRLAGRGSRLIEYKDVARAGPAVAVADMDTGCDVVGSGPHS